MLRSLKFKRACLRSDQDSLSELIYLSYLELNIRSLKGTVWLVSIFLLIYFPCSLFLTLLSALYSEISWDRLYPVLNFVGSVSLDILGIATGASGMKCQRVIDSRLVGFCAQMYMSEYRYRNICDILECDDV